MKKLRSMCALVLSLLLCLPMMTAPACAADVLGDLPDFTLASGAGAWSTDLNIYPDGTFEGVYHDFDMGDTGPGYSYGTIHICEFDGRFSDIRQIDDYTWSMKVETLNCLYEEGKMWIEEQIKYVGSEPMGMPEVGGEIRIYLPGCPAADLSEGFLFWVNITGTNVVDGKLTSFAVYNVEEDTGFSANCPDPAPYLQKWAALARSKTAYATTQQIEVDGLKVTFETYALRDANGNDTNYVKLRDVAYVLNDSPARFQVGWDGNVTITTGAVYSTNGSEFKTPYSGDRTYQDASASTVINGVPVELSAILLTDDDGNGYTYYKLRDLGAALGFTVDWTAERGIFIETE